MNFTIGEFVSHPCTKRPNRVLQTRKSQGVLWLGFGTQTIGWVKAEDCKLWDGPKVLRGTV